MEGRASLQKFPGRKEYKQHNGLLSKNIYVGPREGGEDFLGMLIKGGKIFSNADARSRSCVMGKRQPDYEYL